ncbi:MAG TPA: tRNA lysidine(34) synthetase TilS [Waddliaceae bacterium]
MGLSGGPDSMALFHLLLEANYPFEVAHIDHGWRKESGEEAHYLVKMCTQLGIPFHLKKLSPPTEMKNLEDRCRKARLEFFKSVLISQNLKGVFLGHHADDQAETVLKRLFEGASIGKLRGLIPKAEVADVALYRPLLKVKKRDIVNWLDQKGIRYFLDSTNEDTRFLRSRLRNELIPTLATQFGKEVTLNLCRLGEAAAELGDFLEELIAPLRDDIQENSEKISFDFNAHQHLSPFLWKLIIRNLFERRALSLPHSVLEAILAHVQRGSCNKSLQVGGEEVCIHKKSLTIRRKNSVDREW